MSYLRFVGLLHIGIALLAAMGQLATTITLSPGLLIISYFTSAFIGISGGWILATHSLVQFRIDGRIPVLVPPAYPSETLFESITLTPGWITVIGLEIVSVVLMAASNVIPEPDHVEMLRLLCGGLFATTMAAFGIRLIWA